MIMEKVVWIIFGSLAFASLAFGVYSVISERRRYNKGRNPYHRICKKCGAHQELHQGLSGFWWEQTGQGSDINCKCIKDAEYRPW